MRRKAILLVTAMSAALVLAAGVAFAAAITCNSDPFWAPMIRTVLVARTTETIKARAGDGYADGNGGNYTIYSGAGADRPDARRAQKTATRSMAGAGNDFINAASNETSRRLARQHR